MARPAKWNIDASKRGDITVVKGTQVNRWAKHLSAKVVTSTADSAAMFPWSPIAETSWLSRSFATCSKLDNSELQDWNVACR